MFANCIEIDVVRTKAETAIQLFGEWVPILPGVIRGMIRGMMKAVPPRRTHEDKAPSGFIERYASGSSALARGGGP
jgi:hypothetical protein